MLHILCVLHTTSCSLPIWIPGFALNCIILTVIAWLIFQIHVGLLWQNIPVFQDEFCLFLFILLKGFDVCFLIFYMHPTISFWIINTWSCFFFFNLILFFKLYIVVLVLPNIKMNPPQVYMCFFAPVISREITYFLPASFN